MLEIKCEVEKTLLLFWLDSNGCNVLGKLCFFSNLYVHTAVETIWQWSRVCGCSLLLHHCPSAGTSQTADRFITPQRNRWPQKCWLCQSFWLCQASCVMYSIDWHWVQLLAAATVVGEMTFWAFRVADNRKCVLWCQSDSVWTAWKLFYIHDHFFLFQENVLKYSLHLSGGGGGGGEGICHCHGENLEIRHWK